MKKNKKKIIAWESWSQQENYILDPEADLDVVNNNADPDAENYQDRITSNIHQAFMAEEMPITTPFGKYMIDSPFLPSKRWDCWIGYTNFSLNEIQINHLNETEGVEVLSVLGRYTFAIGVAKQFNFSDVRKCVEEKLCSYNLAEMASLLSDENIDKVKEFESSTSKKYWVVLLTTTDEVKFFETDHQEEFIKNYKKFEKEKNRKGGYIYGKTF